MQTIHKNKVKKRQNKIEVKIVHGKDIPKINT